jgi:hypothetical protein
MHAAPADSVSCVCSVLLPIVLKIQIACVGSVVRYAATTPDADTALGLHSSPRTFTTVPEGEIFQSPDGSSPPLVGWCVTKR